MPNSPRCAASATKIAAWSLVQGVFQSSRVRIAHTESTDGESVAAIEKLQGNGKLLLPFRLHVYGRQVAPALFVETIHAKGRKTLLQRHQKSRTSCGIVMIANQLLSAEINSGSALVSQFNDIVAPLPDLQVSLHEASKRFLPGERTQVEVFA